MWLVRHMSWYPEFNGSHFGLPLSFIYQMSWLGGKMVWTMTYSHRPHWALFVGWDIRLLSIYCHCNAYPVILISPHLSRLEVQLGVHQWRHDCRSHASARCRDADLHVRPTAHDQVCLSAQLREEKLRALHVVCVLAVGHRAPRHINRLHWTVTMVVFLITFCPSHTVACLRCRCLGKTCKEFVLLRALVTLFLVVAQSSFSSAFCCY